MHLCVTCTSSERGSGAAAPLNTTPLLKASFRDKAMVIPAMGTSRAVHSLIREHGEKVEAPAMYSLYSTSRDHRLSEVRVLMARLLR